MRAIIPVEKQDLKPNKKQPTFNANVRRHSAAYSWAMVSVMNSTQCNQQGGSEYSFTECIFCVCHIYGT